MGSSSTRLVSMVFQVAFDASCGFENNIGGKGKVHVRVQQRTGRKALTIIEGMPETVRLPKSGKSLSVDFHKLLKAMKVEFNTNGSLQGDANHGRIIQLSGDI